MATGRHRSSALLGVDHAGGPSVDLPILLLAHTRRLANIAVVGIPLLSAEGVIGSV